MEWIFLKLAEHGLCSGAVAAVDCFLEVIVGAEETLQNRDDGISPVGVVALQFDDVEGFQAVVDELLPFDAVTSWVADVELPRVVAVGESELDAADGLAVVDSRQVVSVAAGAVPCPVGETAAYSYQTPDFDWAYRHDFR